MSETTKNTYAMQPNLNKLSTNEPFNITVTAHAIRRFQERGSGIQCEMKIAELLRRGVVYGKEQVFKDKNEEMRQMLKHNCLKARFFKENSLIIVLVDNVIMTVHGGEAGKWKNK